VRSQSRCMWEQHPVGSTPRLSPEYRRLFCLGRPHKSSHLVNTNGEPCEHGAHGSPLTFHLEHTETKGHEGPG
jgi:hypothetical protein